MKQVEFLWDTGSDMIVLARNVNAVLEELQGKRFKILEIKDFGKGKIWIKDVKVLPNGEEFPREGLIVCIVYDDNR